ncbi:hypothetical protein XENORESO_008631 [Xenotaenia resolanae]|uniref:Uncharacterized protein n=1 Tax=Xenotaenia resolanae TaxID=208358 RepID=A0ABV0W7Y3_9TELE
MDPSKICWLLALRGFVFLMFPPAAADSSSLNCSIIRLPTCYFRYQLAQWTYSADCDSYWEDHNRVVIARGSLFNETIVETLTDEHIDLKICQHHLRHRTDCLEVKQTLPRERTEWVVDCRVNCSFFKLDDCPPTTKFCLSESVCFDSFTGALIFGVPAAVLVLIIACAIFKYKRRTSAASNMLYAEPPEQVQIQPIQVKNGD